jgi:hypothetical protein
VAGFGLTGDNPDDIVTLKAGTILKEDCKDAPDEYFCTGISSEHFKDYGIFIIEILFMQLVGLMGVE